MGISVIFHSHYDSDFFDIQRGLFHSERVLSSDKRRHAAVLRMVRCWEREERITTRITIYRPPKPSLRTANLSVQAEYALYVGDESETPALPASKFQLQQAVRTAFWGRYAGRIVSISHNGVYYFYEVQLGSGRVVLEPETHLTAAPELDATLTPCETHRALTVREIESRMDTPDYDSGASSAYCQWNGIDQLNPEVR